MTAHQRGNWLDGQQGRLIRPYTASNGRTRSTAQLTLLSMVKTTGQAIEAHFADDHARVLRVCHAPTSVTEVSARIHLPIVVTKILLCDLIDCHAVSIDNSHRTADATDRHLLEALLHGLQQRL